LVGSIGNPKEGTNPQCRNPPAYFDRFLPHCKKFQEIIRAAISPFNANVYESSRLEEKSRKADAPVFRRRNRGAAAVSNYFLLL
jgi:hypothetical protein